MFCIERNFVLGMRLCTGDKVVCRGGGNVFCGTRESVCVFATRRNEGGAAVSMFLVQRYGAAIAVFECKPKIFF